MISIEEITDWLESYKFGRYIDIKQFLAWLKRHAKSGLKYKLNYKIDEIDKERTKRKLHTSLKGE